LVELAGVNARDGLGVDENVLLQGIGVDVERLLRGLHGVEVLVLGGELLDLSHHTQDLLHFILKRDR